MKIIVLVAWAALAAAQCVPVSHDRILAGDLSASVPVLRSIDPGSAVGFAPAPGLTRVFAARELIEFAEGHGLAVPAGTVFSGICVVREAHPVSPDDLRAALLASIAVDGAGIDLLDYSLQPLPDGKLEFPVSGLNKPPADAWESPVIWRGRLIYDGQHSFGLWAKVRIRVPAQWIVSRDAIAAGSTIRADQIKELPMRPFPFPASAVLSRSEVIGKITHRNIPAGQAILSTALDARREVNRGDRVRVKVDGGSAILSFEAQAETAGIPGDTVLVKNPTSGRSFRARVEGEGFVSVHCPLGEGR